MSTQLDLRSIKRRVTVTPFDELLRAQGCESIRLAVAVAELDEQCAGVFGLSVKISTTVPSSPRLKPSLGTSSSKATTSSNFISSLISL